MILFFLVDKDKTPKNDIELQSGFTLIELLVVISIISLLSSVVLSSISSARESARDVRRKQDLRQIKRALHAYFNDHGDYMGIDSGCGQKNTGDPNLGDGDGWFNADSNDFSFYDTSIAECLVDGGYLPSEFLSPSGSSVGDHTYMKYTCPTGTILYANLESVSGKGNLPPESEGLCSANYVEDYQEMDYYIWVSKE